MAFSSSTVTRLIVLSTDLTECTIALSLHHSINQLNGEWFYLLALAQLLRRLLLLLPQS